LQVGSSTDKIHIGVDNPYDTIGTLIENNLVSGGQRGIRGGGRGRHRSQLKDRPK